MNFKPKLAEHRVQDDKDHRENLSAFFNAFCAQNVPVTNWLSRRVLCSLENETDAAKIPAFSSQVLTCSKLHHKNQPS